MSTKVANFNYVHTHTNYALNTYAHALRTYTYIYTIRTGTNVQVDMFLPTRPMHYCNKYVQPVSECSVIKH